MNNACLHSPSHEKSDRLLLRQINLPHHVRRVNQERMEREKASAVAAMNLSLAHAAAMVGRWVLCRRALTRAEDSSWG